MGVLGESMFFHLALHGLFGMGVFGSGLLGHLLTVSDRSPEDVIRRLDAVIADIRKKYHGPCFDGSSPSDRGDVLIVAHGHILRAFAMRWTGKPLTETALILEAGGVGTLR